MRHAQTAVLERGERYTGRFATEPYEVAWAGEARFFVQVVDGAPGTTAVLTTQLSPDGLTWADAEDTAPREIDGATAGMVTWRIREFGGWLRLRGEVRGAGDEGPKLRIYLVAKE